jgi:hypothetical protein
MLVFHFFEHVFFVFPLLAYIIITNGFGIKLNKRVQLWSVIAACFVIMNHILTSMWLKWGKTFYPLQTVVYTLKTQRTEQNILVAGYMLVSVIFYIYFFRSGR